MGRMKQKCRPGIFFLLSLARSVVRVSQRHQSPISGRNAHQIVLYFFPTVVDIDLLGSFHAAHAAFPHLKETQGNIIFITAGQGIQPYSHQAHVGAAKVRVCVCVCVCVCVLHRALSLYALFALPPM